MYFAPNGEKSKFMLMHSDVFQCFSDGFFRDRDGGLNRRLGGNISHFSTVGFELYSYFNLNKEINIWLSKLTKTEKQKYNQSSLISNATWA